MAAIWKIPAKLSASETKQIESLKEDLDPKFGKISPVVLEHLYRRGYTTAKLLSQFLTPTDADIFSSYKQMYGITEIAKRIITAVTANEQIIIYGDYDVDGITSTSLLWRFLYWELKAKVKPFVPHRQRDGYGLNYDTIRDILSEYTNERVLLITVDCGCKDEELIQKLKGENPNLEIIVTDHHQYEENSLKYILHPLHPESKLDQKYICACAVVWNLICCLKENLGMSVNKSGLELVALATVCDLMPLVGINRSIVTFGLKQFAHTNIMGIKALCRISEVDIKNLDVYHLGFVLGPRLNASGRIGEPMDGVRLLCTQSASAAEKFAANLNSLNQERQELTKDILSGIEEQYTQQAANKLIFVHNDQWTEGIVGLIAGRLQEKYGLPAIALTKKEDYWVGSARSNKHIDITKLISSQTSILIRFGGHHQAAGLTVHNDNLQELKINLTQIANQTFDETHLQKELDIAGEITAEEVDDSLAQSLTLLEPFGQENPEPVFLISKVSLTPLKYFGTDKRHLSLLINNSPVELVWFNHQNPKTDKTYDIAITVGYNNWQGRKKLQLKIRDTKLHHEKKTKR